MKVWIYTLGFDKFFIRASHTKKNWFTSAQTIGTMFQMDIFYNLHYWNLAFETFEKYSKGYYRSIEFECRETKISIRSQFVW